MVILLRLKDVQPILIVHCAKRAALWRKFRIDRSNINKSRYYEQAGLCKTLIYEHEKTKESSVVNQSNLGAFYRFINKRMSCKSGVGPLKSTSGSLLINDRDKATALNDYFCSVFTPDDGKCPTFNRRVADNVSFNRIDITLSLIHIWTLPTKRIV